MPDEAAVGQCLGREGHVGVAGDKVDALGGQGVDGLCRVPKFERERGRGDLGGAEGPDAHVEAPGSLAVFVAWAQVDVKIAKAAAARKFEEEIPAVGSAFRRDAFLAAYAGELEFLVDVADAGEDGVEGLARGERAT